MLLSQVFIYIKAPMHINSQLGFSKFEKFLTFGTVKRVELRNHAKFCRNRSNRGRDIVISRLSKIADAAMLDF